MISVFISESVDMPSFVWFDSLCELIWYFNFANKYMFWSYMGLDLCFLMHSIMLWKNKKQNTDITFFWINFRKCFQDVDTVLCDKSECTWENPDRWQAVV